MLRPPRPTHWTDRPREFIWALLPAGSLNFPLQWSTTTLHTEKWFSIFFACEVTVTILGPVLGRTDFSYFWGGGRQISLLILSPDLSPRFCGGKSAQKILQENPRQNPPKLIQEKSPTNFAEGPG